MDAFGGIILYVQYTLSESVIMQAFGIKKVQSSSEAPGSSAPKSGIESMLRALGLGEFLDAVKTMATPENVATIKLLLDGDTVEKLIKFVDGIDELNERLERIERNTGVEERNNEPDTIRSDDLRSGYIEPDPDAGDGVSAGFDDRSDDDVSRSGRSHGRVRRRGPASGDVDTASEIVADQN